MRQERSDKADPKRSIGLLWGASPSGRRGFKPRYSLEQVVLAAIGVADAEGVQALTVRRIAEALGVSTMSIYTYVPTKADLAELMLDRIQLEARDPDPAQHDWREALILVSMEEARLAERHPWMLDLARHYAPLGPHVARRQERILHILEGAGLDDVTKGLMMEVLFHFLRGALQRVRDARVAQRLTGVTEDQWLAEGQPHLTAYLDAERFPYLLRAHQAWRSADPALLGDAQRRFKFGLDVILDGIAAKMAEQESISPGR